jgi:hypothetical protein
MLDLEVALGERWRLWEQVQGHDPPDEGFGRTFCGWVLSRDRLVPIPRACPPASRFKCRGIRSSGDGPAVQQVQQRTACTVAI